MMMDGYKGDLPGMIPTGLKEENDMGL